MKVELKLCNLHSYEWNNIFTSRYQRMFKLADIDNLKLQKQKYEYLHKELKNQPTRASLDIESKEFKLPARRTLGIVGIGYWLGWVHWDNSNGQAETVLEAKPSWFWLCAPIATIGLFFALWVIDKITGFLSTLELSKTAFLVIAAACTVLIGLASYFVHYFGVKRVFQQLAVFLKFKGIPFEFAGEKFEPELVYASNQQQALEAMREAVPMTEPLRDVHEAPTIQAPGVPSKAMPEQINREIH